MVRFLLITPKEESSEDAITASTDEYVWQPDETALINAILSAAGEFRSDDDINEARSEPIDFNA